MALIAFNRPECAARTLNAIRAVEPRQLYLIADGPRADHPEDRDLCNATRQVLEQVDWPCDVQRRYAPTNLGLEANVELGLDWVFEQADRCVVLEDDCVPDPSFFRFADELLERYATDRRVWFLTGNGLGLAESHFGGASYAFSGWAGVWGWATWADRWQQHRAIFPRDHVPRPGDERGDQPRRTEPVPSALPTLVTRSGLQHFTDAARSNDTVTNGWDKHLWLSVATRGGLAITPARSMVQNVGFGLASATHTSGTSGDGSRYGVAEQMGFPLVHPDRVALNVGVERELELVLARVGGRTARLARQLIRSPRLRRLINSIVSSRPAILAARALSRLMPRRRSS